MLFVPKNFDVIFWQNIPSIHQAPLMRALADSGKRVLVVVAEDLPEARRVMGWAGIDYGNADLIISPSVRERLALVEENRDAAAHIFSGLNTYPAISHAMAQLARGRHNHIAIISEPWDSRGLKGRLRKIKFALRRNSLKHVDTVFACGNSASQQFISLGCDPAKIAAFGYFVAGPKDKLLIRKTGVPSLLFVGTFTEWKDPAIVLDALTMTPTSIWDLTMVGDGPLRAGVVEMAKASKSADRISFRRSMPNEALLTLIAASDLLVLPSKYDGWGAVVNEALMAGTPVIVSRACGASDLVRSNLQGEVIEPGSPMELARALTMRFSSSPLSDEARKRLQGWANTTISPMAAAEYLWDAVTRDGRARIPTAPWAEPK